MIYRKYITTFLIAILQVLGAGCFNDVDNLPNKPQTETAFPNTSSSVSTSTPSQMLVDAMDCEPVVANANIMNEGFLIVSDGRGAYYSIDLQTINVEKLAENSMYISFSPSFQAFAYLSLGEELLVVKSKQGTITLPKKSTWLSIARWIGEETIQINEDDTSTSPQIILNPFNGDVTRLTADFEDIYSLDSNINWDGWSLVSYSPNLGFAVYPRLSKDELALVLVSTDTNELIAKLFPIDITSYPQWSPGGEFVIGEPLNIDEHGQLMGSELFLVDPAGDIQRLTAFSETYEYPLVKEYRWSPNYSDIAFWVTGNRLINSESAYLGVVNTSSQETNLMCITAKSIFLTFAPVWSTDQGFLAVNADINGTNRLLIIDLATLEYRELDFNFNAIPVGWVAFKP